MFKVCNSEFKECIGRHWCLCWDSDASIVNTEVYWQWLGDRDRLKTCIQNNRWSLWLFLLCRRMHLSRDATYTFLQLFGIFFIITTNSFFFKSDLILLLKNKCKDMAQSLRSTFDRDLNLAKTYFWYTSMLHIIFGYFEAVS